MPSFKQSVSFALNGLKLVLKEKHIKVHLVCTCLVIIAGLYFHISQTEWLVCFLVFGLVVGMEIINTAIEQLVNLVSPQHNPKAGAIKDMAAGAVLFSSVIAIVCGVLIFGKYILDLLQANH